VISRNSNINNRNLENNPKCLLIIKKNEKIPRNEKCPATGKKYKHCCGAL
jgi:preprotein translocase subunit SecA